jgi:hypothetical protein
MARYDAAILEKHAARIERGAYGLIGGWTVGLFLVGVAIAGLMSKAGYDFWPTALITGGIGLALGFGIGKRLSFQTLVQMHILLCTVSQEKHLADIAKSVRREERHGKGEFIDRLEQLLGEYSVAPKRP